MALSKEKLRSKFQEEYQRLNEQQKLAVDTVEGPVMVIAGPGTGKTQILASRIGKILLETDTAPENILCLTYTDAGVVAMRKRLLQFIGPEAYQVNIYTFHAFCNDVIQENLSHFEKTSLDPVSELESIGYLKQLIDDLPKNHPLKRYRGDVYYEINNLAPLFSVMKKEGWTVEWINERIDAYINDLPNREEFIYKRKYKDNMPGDLKKDQIEAEKEKMAKLRAAVALSREYDKIMKANNRYDFDDMINWVIKAFTEEPALLNRYQEQFLYILVDEFQDTSGTQNRLVQLLINYWEKPNIFVVGDDDQSIFRFQGANVENMLEFANQYSDDLLRVVLTNNYRSVQPILNISGSLINRNDERLVKRLPGLSKELVSSNTRINTLDHQPVIREYATQRDEMAGIALEVQKLIGEGVRPGRIAIIYKENRYGELLMDIFSKIGLPAYTKRFLNILDLPLAKKILTLLRYLDAEHDQPFGGEELLFELLHFDWFNIPPITIAELTYETYEKRSDKVKTGLRQQLIQKSELPPKDLFTPALHENLKKVSAILEELIQAVPNLTLQGLFELLIRKAGVLNIIMQSPQKHAEFQILTSLFNFIKEETRRNPSMDLHGLVTLFDLMQREGLRIPLVQVNGNEDGIHLLTAHGSKGLEFGYVFFAGCNAGLWEKKRKPGGGYSFPDTIFNSLPASKTEEELRRLFYVALTRAELHLFISFARFRDDGKEQEPSKFIAEILDANDRLKVTTVALDNEVMDQFTMIEFTAAAPEIEKMEKVFVDRMLAGFKMNVTALNNYLRCPLEFYFKNLIRIPSPKNEATEFGSSVHYALEQLFRKRTDTGRFPSLPEFINDFDWYMHRHRESFTREQFDRRLEYGQEVLTNYYGKYIDSFNTVVSIERNINNVVINEVPIKGKIDKLEFDGKEVNVVDYKTGDPDKAQPKLQGPSEKQPNGGDYWRQAVFYKLLVDNEKSRDWRVVSTEFDFIEPDKKKNYRRSKIAITPADTATVAAQISDTWKKIQAHDFYTGCGKEDCHWCNFVKTNNMAVALHEIKEGEEEED